MIRAFRARRFTGMGSATLKALRDLDAGGSWAISGARGEMAAGNGGAMRIAPLAFVVDLHTERQLVRDIVRITHANDEAYAGALAVLVAIQDRGQATLPAFLAHVCDELPDSVTRDRLRDVASLPEDTPIEGVAARLGSSGYVAETVPLALFAGYKMAAGQFEAGLEEIVKVAEDADTIASISGQVAGVRLGLSGLPNALLDTIPEHSLIEELGRAFARAVGEKWG